MNDRAFEHLNDDLPGGRLVDLTPAVLRHVQLTVAGHAHDPADLALLLDMLGLRP